MEVKKAENKKNRSGPHNRLWDIWYAMHVRCTNKKYSVYARYGARGIKVCSEWESYETFAAWANANGYRSDLTIDRINPRGNYEPSNCRWATRMQQTANLPRYKNSKSLFKGVTWHSKDKRWQAAIGRTWLGGYRVEVLAAFAYDEAAFARWGEYARLNFPEKFKRSHLINQPRDAREG